MSPEHVLSRRPEAERHEGPIERRVGLVDLDERDTCQTETFSLAYERRLVCNAEHKGVRVVRKVSGAAFASSVRDHRGAGPATEVTADQDVVS